VRDANNGFAVVTRRRRVPRSFSRLVDASGYGVRYDGGGEHVSLHSQIVLEFTVSDPPLPLLSTWFRRRLRLDCGSRCRNAGMVFAACLHDDLAASDLEAVV